MANTSLYSKAVKITEEYLGPAGERFIRRQITTHLNIKPEALNAQHLPKLVSWCVVAFALVTKNKKDREEFAKDLKSLGASE